MLRISATALTYLKNRRRGILPRPQRVHRCAFAGCHVAGGPGGIDLRTYNAVIAGGSKGAIVIAGDAGESELVKQIVEGKMPPNGPPLPAAQIQLITDWINEGAKNNLEGETENKPLIPPADSFPPPDVNRDGVVNILDLIQAALQFGQVGTHLAGDVNDDGTVDVADLILISVNLSENAAAPAPTVNDSSPTANYHSSSVQRQFQALAALESLVTRSRGGTPRPRPAQSVVIPNAAAGHGNKIAAKLSQPFQP